MKNIDYEKKGKIGFIMLNRGKLNLLTFKMVSELHNIWDDFQNDDKLWVAILSSTGKNFSAGFDIKEILKIFEKGKFSSKESSVFGYKRMTPNEHSVTKPIIVATKGIVNGGGLYFTLQSDIRIATPQTVFGMGEGKLNLPADFTGLFIKYMPRAIINEMLFTGKMFSAQRFYELGIINRIVDEEELMAESIRIAENICELGPISLRAMKQLIEHSYYMDYASIKAFTASMIVPIFNSEDTKEGFNALLDKRKPIWKLK